MVNDEAFNKIYPDHLLTQNSIIIHLHHVQDLYLWLFIQISVSDYTNDSSHLDVISLLMFFVLKASVITHLKLK